MKEAKYRRFKIIWMGFICGLVLLILAVGGITRLTRSGLSIVEWKILSGTVPPVTEAAWQAEFNQYRQTPEFRIVNRNMDLAGFKRIYFWEYLHRLLGRLVGMVTFLPLLFLLLARALEKRLFWRAVLLLFLGGLQGALGWYMVKSGLVDEPRVSHFRLSMHLGLALLIAALAFWFLLELLKQSRAADQLVQRDQAARAFSGGSQLQFHPGAKRFVAFSVIFLFLQLLSGAIAAGIRAGHVYNTFPLMGDTFLPFAFLAHDPWHSPAALQLLHRMGAYITLLLFSFLAWSVYKAGHKKLALLLFCTLLFQIALGVFVLLSAAEIKLAALHQLAGTFLFQLAIYLLFISRQGPLHAISR